MLLKTPKIFSLLSIGKRGVGKTVFLAGSYAEMHANSQSNNFGVAELGYDFYLLAIAKLLNNQYFRLLNFYFHTLIQQRHNFSQLRFECQDSEVQTSIENVLRYITQTNLYPPPTIKITNFNFKLKRRNRWGTETLCHFRWWDIPGESCNIRNPDFKKIVYASHGCCVFVDAYALVHNSAYLQTLEDVIKQVMAIANLVHLNNLKYAFAVILTKCDLLQPSSFDKQQLKKYLQQLVIGLDEVKADYQIFYSFIPIVNVEGTTNLKATGAAAPLIWLAWKVSKAYNSSLMNNLLKLITRQRSISSQPQLEEADGSLQSLFRSADVAMTSQKRLGLSLLTTTPRKLWLLTLIAVAFVGVISLPLVDYKRFLSGDPNNFSSLENLATSHYISGRFAQALPLFERLVQQQPNRLELRLQLAQIYERTYQEQKAETAYDQVLAQQRNNFAALVGKAVLRKTQGDTKTAKLLFAQAEKAAPAEIKAQIRAIAQNTLTPPAKLIPEAK